MNEINNDELRRELRAVDAEQKQVERNWLSTIREWFDPERGASSDDKARLLGLPNRRGALRIGGMSVAGAALLAACGDDNESPSTTGTNSTTTAAGGAATGATGGSGDGNLDVTLAKTAASLEKLAIDAYTVAVESGLVTTAAIGDAAKLFQSHHVAHFDALNGLLESLGEKAVTEPNEVVKAAVVDPAVAAAKTEADIVDLAYTLEDAAAQTYVFGITALSKPELRSTLATIAGVEARHRAILAFMVQEKTPAELFPTGFFSSENPLPAAALIS